MIESKTKYLGSGNLNNHELGCPDCGGSCGEDMALSDGLSGLLSPDVTSIGIVDRFPKKGLPPQGLPFSIEVEANIDWTIGSQVWNWASSPFSFGAIAQCPDVVVAARQTYSDNPKVLSVGKIITDSTKGCVGSVKLTFPASYRPTEKDWIILEVYDDGTTRQEIENEKVTPLLKSKPLQPAISYQKGLQYGLYENKTGILGISTGSLNPFTGMGGTIKSLTTLLAVGAGGYLIWKNGDAIKAYISEKTEAIKPANIKKKLTS